MSTQIKNVVDRVNEKFSVLLTENCVAELTAKPLQKLLTADKLPKADALVDFYKTQTKGEQS